MLSYFSFGITKSYNSVMVTEVGNMSNNLDQ